MRLIRQEIAIRVLKVNINTTINHYSDLTISHIVTKYCEILNYFVFVVVIKLKFDN